MCCAYRKRAATPTAPAAIPTDAREPEFLEALGPVLEELPPAPAMVPFPAAVSLLTPLMLLLVAFWMYALVPERRVRAMIVACIDRCLEGEQGKRVF